MLLKMEEENAGMYRKYIAIIRWYYVIAVSPVQLNWLSNSISTSHEDCEILAMQFNVPAEQL